MSDLIKNPDLLLSHDASSGTGTLDSNPWEDPEIFAALHTEESTMLTLCRALITFLVGALKTWKRFLSEFNEGSIIASLTPEEALLAFMHWMQIKC